MADFSGQNPDNNAKKPVTGTPAGNTPASSGAQGEAPKPIGTSKPHIAQGNAAPKPTTGMPHLESLLAHAQGNVPTEPKKPAAPTPATPKTVVPPKPAAAPATPTPAKPVAPTPSVPMASPKPATIPAAPVKPVTPPASVKKPEGSKPPVLPPMPAVSKPAATPVKSVATPAPTKKLEAPKAPVLPPKPTTPTAKPTMPAVSKSAATPAKPMPLVKKPEAPKAPVLPPKPTTPAAKPPMPAVSKTTIPAATPAKPAAPAAKPATPTPMKKPEAPKAPALPPKPTTPAAKPPMPAASKPAATSTKPMPAKQLEAPKVPAATPMKPVTPTKKSEAVKPPMPAVPKPATTPAKSMPPVKKPEASKTVVSSKPAAPAANPSMPTKKLDAKPAAPAAKPVMPLKKAEAPKVDTPKKDTKKPEICPPPKTGMPKPPVVKPAEKSDKKPEAVKTPASPKPAAKPLSGVKPPMSAAPKPAATPAKPMPTAKKPEAPKPAALSKKPAAPAVSAKPADLKKPATPAAPAAPKKAAAAPSPLDSKLNLFDKKKEGAKTEGIAKNIVNLSDNAPKKMILGSTPGLDTTIIDRSFLLKRKLKFVQMGFFVALLVLLGSFSFFYTQLNPDFNAFGANVAQQVDTSNQEIYRTQTDFNSVTFLTAQMILGDFSFTANQYQDYKNQLKSTSLSADERSTLSSQMVVLQDELLLQLGDLQKVLKQPFTSPLYRGEEELTPLEERKEFETKLVAFLQEKLRDASKDQGSEDALLYRNALELAKNRKLVNSIKNANLTKLKTTPEELDELITTITSVAKNELSIVNSIKTSRINWAEVLSSIITLTKESEEGLIVANEGPYQMDLFEAGGTTAIMYDGYTLDSENERISVNGTLKTPDEQTFSTLANLIERIESSPKFRNVDYRSFSKSGTREKGYQAVFRIGFELETADSGEDTDDQPTQ